MDYEENKFAIIRSNCRTCGLFSFYNTFLYCLQNYIINNYIPIIDIEAFPNVFNGFKNENIKNNSWEYLFNQPFGYELANVIKKAKKIEYINCTRREHSSPSYTNFYKKSIAIDYWHYFVDKYIPIKNEIIKLKNKITKKLFIDSNNILGILIRGTDYIARRPKEHPIPPEPDIVIQDIKEMYKKYHYDYLFITTEDTIIRNKFINNFGQKLKFILPKNIIKYDYKKKYLLSYNNNIKGNLENIKIYLISILILSNCIDIIASRTNGAVAAFIFSKGFRNSKIYYLGIYS